MLESAQIFIISTAFFTLQAEHKQRNVFFIVLVNEIKKQILLKIFVEFV